MSLAPLRTASVMRELTSLTTGACSASPRRVTSGVWSSSSSMTSMSSSIPFITFSKEATES